MVLHQCPCTRTFDRKDNFVTHQKTCKAYAKIVGLEARLEEAQRHVRELTDALVRNAPDAPSSQLLAQKDQMLREKDMQITTLNQQLTSALKRVQPKVNITNNVTVNVFGQESLQHIDRANVLQLVKHPPTSVPRFIQMVYEQPANAAIRCANIREPHYIVWKGAQFVAQSKESVHRDLFVTNQHRMMAVVQESVEEMEARVHAARQEADAEEHEERARELEYQQKVAKATAEAEARAEAETKCRDAVLRRAFVNGRKREYLQDLLRDLPEQPPKRQRQEPPAVRDLKQRQKEIQECERYFSDVERGHALAASGKKPSDAEDQRCKLLHAQCLGEIQRVML